MNALNSVGGANAANAPAGTQETEGSDFDAIFQEGLINTGVVVFQFIASDIIESVMKDESAVD